MSNKKIATIKDLYDFNEKTEFIKNGIENYYTNNGSDIEIIDTLCPCYGAIKNVIHPNSYENNESYFEITNEDTTYVNNQLVSLNDITVTSINKKTVTLVIEQEEYMDYVEPGYFNIYINDNAYSEGSNNSGDLLVSGIPIDAKVQIVGNCVNTNGEECKINDIFYFKNDELTKDDDGNFIYYYTTSWISKPTVVLEIGPLIEDTPGNFSFYLSGYEQTISVSYEGFENVNDNNIVTDATSENKIITFEDEWFEGKNVDSNSLVVNGYETVGDIPPLLNGEQLEIGKNYRINNNGSQNIIIFPQEGNGSNVYKNIMFGQPDGNVISDISSLSIICKYKNSQSSTVGDTYKYYVNGGWENGYAPYLWAWKNPSTININIALSFNTTAEGNNYTISVGGYKFTTNKVLAGLNYVFTSQDMTFNYLYLTPNSENKIPITITKTNS